MKKRNAFTTVDLATGAALAHGQRLPRPKMGGEADWLDPSNNFSGDTPAEWEGVGWFPEYEDREALGTGQKHADPVWQAPDMQNNRVVLFFAAMDRPAEEITSERLARAVELVAKVKADAEAARLIYLTPGSGKALEYEAKRKEAMSYLAAKATAAPSDPTINGTLYPWAYETAKALAGGEPSTAQIKVQCELFATRATSWEAIGRQIAAKEQAATDAIITARDAADDAAMEAAAVVVWA